MTDGTDRFAAWRPFPARLLLLAVALLLIASMVVPITAGDLPPPGSIASQAQPVPAAGAKGAARRDADLALYDRITARVARGEDYYQAAVDEQRRGNYPVRPGPAVRLPTLALASAALGPAGIRLAAILLFAGTLLAWWRRMGTERGGLPFRTMAVALLVPGGALALNARYLVVHEVWAGMLLLLSLGLHRPDREKGSRWAASLAVAALALGIRELALPFVLLMAAMALWRRNWREVAAWSGLAVLFLVLLRVHIGSIEIHVTSADRISPSWIALRGLSGWLSNIVLSSSLHLLPAWLAGPLVVLMLLGWAGWRSPAGSCATLLYLGYGLLFMIVGRSNNFYWGALIAPGMFAGLAFLPRALRSLWRAARGRGRGNG